MDYAYHTQNIPFRLKVVKEVMMFAYKNAEKYNMNLIYIRK